MTYSRDGRTYRSYGEWLRSKKIKISYTNSANGWDASKQKRWDSELDAYRSALKEGLNPAGTTMRDVDNARRKADTLQSATGSLTAD